MAPRVAAWRLSAPRDRGPMRPVRPVCCARRTPDLKSVKLANDKRYWKIEPYELECEGRGYAMLSWDEEIATADNSARSPQAALVPSARSRFGAQRISGIE